MTTLKKTVKNLTAYHHILVFLIILTTMKIVNVFVTQGFIEGLHFAKLGVGLIVISSILHLVFTKLFDAKKKYLHSLISTFLILVMLSHADPEPVRGILVIVLLYVAKFFVKYKGKNIFNPVAFTIGMVTILALFIPALGIPPMDFTGVDIRFPIAGLQVPLPLLPIMLALIINVGRIKKHPLALSFIITSLILGVFIGAYDNDIFSYLIITSFTGVAVIVEPKTAPSNKQQQIVYGVISAVFITGLTIFNVPNSLVVSLLFLNLAYFFYRK